MGQSNIVLNKDQKVLVEEVRKFLKDDREELRVSGPGGSGKTFAISYAIEGYQDIVVGATPSHSAKDVLAESLGKKAVVHTIAYMLKLTVRIVMSQVESEKTGLPIGEEYFLPTKGILRQDLPIYHPDLIIVDEASMINDETYHMIMNSKRPDAKVIWLSDKRQLPPVGQNTDAIPTQDIDVELTIVMRNQGPVLELGNIFRNEIDKCTNEIDSPSMYILNKTTKRNSKLRDDGSYKFLEKRNQIGILAKHYYSQEDPNSFRIICFRNKTVDYYNNQIRYLLFGKEEATKNPYLPGELVISRGFALGKRVIINNGEIFRVVETKQHHNYRFGIPTLSLKLSPDKDTLIPVVAPEGMEKYYEKLNMLRERALNDKFQWRYYYEFKNSFAWFDYSYAINSHKS